MRQLNKWQNTLFLMGAVLMVVGAGIYVFRGSKSSTVIFAAGAVAFASMQMLQKYGGGSVAVKRLCRLRAVADVLFVVAAAFLLEDAFRLVEPLFVSGSGDGYYTYLTYVHNNWVVLLLVAALVEMYTSHRISRELGKEG